MNILHIIAQKPDSTGSGVYLAQTVKGFNALGCHQAVIAGIGPEDAPAFPADVLFRPVRFESPELPFPVVGMSDVMPYRATRYRDLTPEMVECFERAFTEALDDMLTRFAPDLVICHHLYLLTALVAHRRLPCKVVGLSHSTDLRQMDKTDLERAYIRAGVGMLDEIWSLNTAQAAEIGRVYNVRAERIRIVGVGYDDTVFHPADAAQVESEDGCSAQPAGKPVAGSGETHRLELAYAGKIWQKKGVGSLLAALDLLPYPPDKLRLRLRLRGARRACAGLRVRGRFPRQTCAR